MPERPLPHVDASSTRVLVVARDERFRYNIRTRLSTLGEVHIAGEAADSNGAAIICILGHPDVVIMDAGLPWHEGTELVRRVRRATPGVRIVACTWSASANAVAVLVAGPTEAEALDDGVPRGAHGPPAAPSSA
jgi:DNA-binding NarL/FixJ family response regulator